MEATFKTIASPTEEIIFKEKSSKFLGYAFPIYSEEEVKNYLEKLKKEHHSARHWCYAWRLGYGSAALYRANDDGEPSGSAGVPIYGQIQSFNITDVLVVVVRYFGGIKLGVGGLIQAYKSTAQLTLSECEIIEKTLTQRLILQFDYTTMSKVMRVVKEHNLLIINQLLEMDCKISVEIPIDKVVFFEQLFAGIYGVKILQN